MDREQAEAEEQVLYLLRGEDDDKFTLTVSRQGDHWVVELGSATVPGEPGQGDGATFAEAWHNIVAYRHG